MDNLIRIATIVNPVVQLNPNKCYEYIVEKIDEVKSKSPDIIVFPTLALSSASCGSLFKNKDLLDSCNLNLYKLAEYTKDMNSYILVGLPIRLDNKVISAIAVLLNGNILSYVPDTGTYDGLDNYKFGDNSDILPLSNEFGCGETVFSVIPTNGKNLIGNMIKSGKANNQIIICPSCVSSNILDNKSSCEAASIVAQSMDCIVVLCNGGLGETSSPYLYDPLIGLFQNNGSEKIINDDKDMVLVSDIDIDTINQYKGNIPFHKSINIKEDCLLKIDSNPFLPISKRDREVYLKQAFDFQVRSLATRLDHIGLKKLVIGVSGGLDSTMAVLACVKVMDKLNLPISNVVGISMPGFGTTKGTKSNAEGLMQGLGIDFREISITKSVEQHFKDIEHDKGNINVTFENAQARERTQILMDIANDIGAIVVGTGDLSEEILGFSTFGGDHLSNYNINSCFTKTVLRELLKYYIEKDLFPQVSDILQSILDTPISPELLPPDKNDKIIQKTEDILGPYEIQEFYAYYFIKHNFSVQKLFDYSKVAFKGKYTDDYLKEKMKMFFKRFISSQFKRSCAPDAAVFVDFPITNVDFYLSSDARPDFFISQIDTLK